MANTFPRRQRGVYRSQSPQLQGSWDIYHRGNDSAAPRPLMVLIHGGGLRQGQLTAVANQERQLMPMGWNLASIGYRLSPAPNVSNQPMSRWNANRFKDGHIDDAIAGLGAVLREARRFNCDTSRIVLRGHSAGGYLVALLGADVARLRAAGIDSNIVRGCVLVDTAWYNLDQRYDQSTSQIANAFGIDPSKHGNASWRFLDHPSRQAALANMQARSPILRLSATSRPVCIVGCGPNGERRLHDDYFAAIRRLNIGPSTYTWYGNSPYDHNGIHQQIGATTDPPGRLPQGTRRVSDVTRDALLSWIPAGRAAAAEEPAGEEGDWRDALTTPELEEVKGAEAQSAEGECELDRDLEEGESEPCPDLE